MKRNNNISPQQLNELLIIQQAMQARQKDKSEVKTKKKPRGFGVLFLLACIGAIAFFVSGCTQYPECDQTQHGRGNVPAACKSLTYQGAE